MVQRQVLGKKHYAHCYVFPTDTLKVKEKKKKKGQVSLGGSRWAARFRSLRGHAGLVALLNSLLSSNLLQEAGGFFEDASEYDKNLSFQDMNLSRPLLKVVALATRVNSFWIDSLLSACMCGLT